MKKFLLGLALGATAGIKIGHKHGAAIIEWAERKLFAGAKTSWFCPELGCDFRSYIVWGEPNGSTQKEHYAQSHPDKAA